MKNGGTVILIGVLIIWLSAYILSGILMTDTNKTLVRKQLIENNLGEWTVDKTTGKTMFKSVIKFAE